MQLIKKITILSVILGLVVLPSFARIEGGISKDSFYDEDSTIMSEMFPHTVIKTQKYWEKNLLYFNKYRPLFMLSNKELYNLMPRENVSVVQRISTPSIYSISLKTASIKTVSFNSNPASIKRVPQTAVRKINKPDVKLISKYEQAKNPETTPEKKIETALSLKEAKNYKLAIDLLDDVTRKEPYNAYAFYLKGELYSQQNDSENAMKNYIEALKLNPASKQSYLGIAKILEPTNKKLAQRYYDLAR